MGPVPRRVHPGARRLGAGFAAVALALAVDAGAAPGPASDNHSSAVPPTFEQRSAVEKASRSRYRDLEVASLVLILAAGGAAIWWTFRKR